MTAIAPLTGLKVVELARILAGPWAGQVLADLGAEVVKVESPEGDDTRRWGPPFVENPDGTRDAAYFHATNRGKRSVVADFATEEGRALVIDLVREADVLIENFKLGGLAKYRLDYASLARDQPRASVYCSITGFGQDGPYASRAGYDFIVQGMSGIMDLTGDPQGPPQKIGVAYADILTGLYAVIAIQAALHQREATGRGQHIDMALLDVMTGTLANQAMNYLVSGVRPDAPRQRPPQHRALRGFPGGRTAGSSSRSVTTASSAACPTCSICPPTPPGPPMPAASTTAPRCRRRFPRRPAIGSRPLCSPISRNRAFPPARSTPWRKRSPTRRSPPAAWCSTSAKG